MVCVCVWCASQHMEIREQYCRVNSLHLCSSGINLMESGKQGEHFFFFFFNLLSYPLGPVWAFLRQGFMYIRSASDLLCH